MEPNRGSNPDYGVLLRLIVYFGTLFIFFRIIPFDMRHYAYLVFGVISLAAGVYQRIVPMKKVKGIRENDLPAYSKVSGALMFPIGLSMVFIGANTEFSIFTSVLADVIPLAVILLSFIALNIVYIVYIRKRPIDASLKK